MINPFAFTVLLGGTLAIDELICRPMHDVPAIYLTEDSGSVEFVLHGGQSPETDSGTLYRELLMQAEKQIDALVERHQGKETLLTVLQERIESNQKAIEQWLATLQ